MLVIRGLAKDEDTEPGWNLGAGHRPRLVRHNLQHYQVRRLLMYLWQPADNW